MKIIIISGPTASGKSALALQMANHQDVTIINADALQLYQGLPILSSQPSEIEKKLVPHFLYSHFKTSESCSVGLWLKLVKSTVEEAWQDNKTPLIVGGTGMYISKLLDGISEIPAIEDGFKAHARELHQSLGHDKFLQNLIDLGEGDERIKALDKQRLIRAYEVFSQTKKSLFWWQSQPTKKIFDAQIFTHINLNPDRAKLYENCNSRFEIMLKNGALEEVRELILSGVSDDSQVSKTLGFAEIKEFLQQKIPREKMLELATQKTRNYAKRQLTWFRHQFEQKNIFDDNKLAAEFLKNLK